MENFGAKYVVVGVVFVAVAVVAVAVLVVVAVVVVPYSGFHCKRK